MNRRLREKGYIVCECEDFASIDGRVYRTLAAAKRAADYWEGEGLEVWVTENKETR